MVLMVLKPDSLQYCRPRKKKIYSETLKSEDCWSFQKQETDPKIMSHGDLLLWKS